MIRTLWVLEIRRRRPGNLKWGRWAYRTATSSRRRALLNVGILSGGGWEIQTRAAPFDRRK